MTTLTHSFTVSEGSENRAKSFFETDFSTRKQIGFFTSEFEAKRDFDNDFTFAIDDATFGVGFVFKSEKFPGGFFFVFGVLHFNSAQPMSQPAILFRAEGLGITEAQLRKTFEFFFNKFA